MSSTAHTSVIASLDWRSEFATHRDSLVLPLSALRAEGRLARAAESLAAGPVQLDASPWLQPRGQDTARVPADAFRLKLKPLPGRFFPRMAFSGLASGPRDLRACRVLDVADNHLEVTINHPLSPYEINLALRGHAEEAAPGRFVQLFDGPGMQVSSAAGKACYLPPQACVRQDEAADLAFYDRPRLVHHLDAVCRAHIQTLHGGFLKPGMAVLDLMSSWVTHLPQSLPADLHITGLGMNREELLANPTLEKRLVHDLNREPHLPFPDDSFDLVLCTASVEYLVQPQAVAAEVFRVLRPNGYWVVTFSDRWFPPKAIRVWSEMHPFERQGLVLWLLADAGFQNQRTLSLRGLKRPADDIHTAQRDFSDPLFAVWGQV